MIRQAAVSKKIVEVCRLMPASPDDPDRCHKVARTVVQRCKTAYKNDKARCKRLAIELGVRAP